MKFILEFADYKNLKTNLGRGVILSNWDRISLGRIIGEWLDKIYGEHLVSDDNFVMNGIELNPEYLRKARNNRNLFKKITFDQEQIINSGVKNVNDLLEFVKEKGYDLFSPDGKYFELVYATLQGCSSKGKTDEERSFDILRNFFEIQGIQIEISSPNRDEDLAGIDGKFTENGVDKTVQVKPLAYIQEYKIDNTKFIVFCDGVLKALITDYLVVINKKEAHVFTTDGVRVMSNYFLVPKTNLILKTTFTES
jgi:hypothetical protein